MKIHDLIRRDIKVMAIKNHSNMAYTKNEKKLKEFLNKKNDFKQSDKQIKSNKPKPSNVKDIRRG